MAAKKKLTKEQSEAQQLLTPVFRLSHPRLYKPGKMEGSKDELYSIEMLFDKTKFKISEIQKPIIAAAKEFFGSIKPGLKMPYRDGDKPYGKEMIVRPEHKGHWVVKATTKAEGGKPATVDKKGQDIINPSELYPGCQARAFIMAFAYSRPEKDGVMFVLDGVQKWKDDTPFSSKKSANEMFGTIAEDEAPELADEDALAGFGDDAPADDNDEVSFF